MKSRERSRRYIPSKPQHDDARYRSGTDRVSARSFHDLFPSIAAVLCHCAPHATTPILIAIRQQYPCRNGAAQNTSSESIVRSWPARKTVQDSGRGVHGGGRSAPVRTTDRFHQALRTGASARSRAGARPRFYCRRQAAAPRPTLGAQPQQLFP
jgi:hypothetical protein